MRLTLLFTMAAISVAGQSKAPLALAASAAATPADPGLYAVLRTSMGPITAKLFEKEAPLTVSKFVALATGTQAWKDPESGAMVERPLYRNLSFDHVIPGYAIQTGDPTGTGRYDCGVRVKDEFVVDLQFDRPGRLGLMNFGRPDTGSCEFFITNDAYPALDRYPGNQGYTIFGQVVDGQDVVEKISNVPGDSRERPRNSVSLLSVTIHRVGSGPTVSQPRTAAAPKKLPRLD